MILTGAHFQFLNDWRDAVIIELTWCIAVGYVHENGTEKFGQNRSIANFNQSCHELFSISLPTACHSLSMAVSGVFPGCWGNGHLLPSKTLFIKNSKRSSAYCAPMLSKVVLAISTELMRQTPSDSPENEATSIVFPVQLLHT